MCVLPISGGRACRAGGPSRLLIRGVESHARHGLDPDKAIFYVLDACHVLSSNAPCPSLLLRFVNRGHCHLPRLKISTEALRHAAYSRSLDNGIPVSQTCSCRL